MGQQSKIRIEHSLDETFVTIEESKLLDDESIKEMQAVLLDVVNSGKHNKMVLNFSEVEFLSSSFLGTLVKMHKSMQEKGGTLTLLNIDPRIMKVFKITQLDKIFTIE